MDETTVNITWNILNDEDLNGIVYYVIKVVRLPDQPRAKEGLPERLERLVPHPDNEAVFDSLEERIFYNVSVAARTNNNTEFRISQTPFSGAITFQTHPASPEEPPSKINVSKTSESFTIDWEEPPPKTHNSDLEFYDIRVRRANVTFYDDGTKISTSDFGETDEPGDWDVSIRVKADVLSVTVSKLHGMPLRPALDYEFQLRTVGETFLDGELVSPWSNLSRVRLLDDSESTICIILYFRMYLYFVKCPS